MAIFLSKKWSGLYRRINLKIGQIHHRTVDTEAKTVEQLFQYDGTFLENETCRACDTKGIHLWAMSYSLESSSRGTEDVIIWNHKTVQRARLISSLLICQ